MRRSSDRTDVELIREAELDAGAFGELYRRHAAAVYGWFRPRLEWAASDLTAETFAQAWLSRGSFRDEVGGSTAPTESTFSMVGTAPMTVWARPS